MVSFDVESLFTNVPIVGTVEAARQKLESDASPADRTTLTPAQIADFTDFVLRSTYLRFDLQTVRGCSHNLFTVINIGIKIRKRQSWLTSQGIMPGSQF